MLFALRGKIFANIKRTVNYLALICAANKPHKLALAFYLCPARAKERIRQIAVRAIVPMPASTAAFDEKAARQALL